MLPVALPSVSPLNPVDDTDRQSDSQSDSRSDRQTDKGLQLGHVRVEGILTMKNEAAVAYIINIKYLKFFN